MEYQMSFPHKITISLGQILSAIALISSLSIGYGTLQVDRQSIKQSQVELSQEIKNLSRELVRTRIALAGLRQQVIDHFENEHESKAIRN
jgi:preprotein translocase subunit SecF